MLASGSDDRKVGPFTSFSQKTLTLVHRCHHVRSPFTYPLQIMLWACPEYRKAPFRVKTMHRANIFGVQFLPQSGNATIVSCAMDHTVQLHVLDRAEVEAWSASSSRPATSGFGAIPPQAYSSSTRIFYNHTSRVKVIPSCVSVF